MGTNRRYAHVIDARMDAKILDRLARDGQLQTLTPQELQLDTLPVTIDPQPKPIRAWVRFGASAVLVDAVMLRWTPRAVGIGFEVGGRRMRAWVWASAVETPEL